MIALESNVVIDTLRGREIVRNRLAQVRSAGQAMAMSCLAFEEVMYGVHRQPNPRRAEEVLKAVLTDVDILAFELADAALACDVRARMAARGLKAPQLDFLIGAHALSRGHTLVTANTRDFQNIPGLQLLDWTRPHQTQDPSHA